MIKKFILFLLVFFIPFLSLADDSEGIILDETKKRILKAIVEHAIIDESVDKNSAVFHDRCEKNGVYHDKYTIDRRCYVTDEQKKQYPYNAVVALVWESSFFVKDSGPYCTGTIVKNPKDMQLYMYTAAHCTDGESLTVHLQDGSKMNLQLVKKGVGVNDADVAVYKIPDNYADKVPFATVDTNAVFDGAQSYDIIGYGALSVMSDKQIHRAKEKFESFLGGKEPKVFISRQDTLVITEPMDILADILPTDERLKGSFNCNLSSASHNADCQTWDGDSGGPVFDKNGNIVAVHTTGVGQMISLQDESYLVTFFGGQEPLLPVLSVVADEEKVKDVEECIKICKETKDCYPKNVTRCSEKMPKQNKLK